MLARGTAVGALTHQKLQEAQKKWEELEVEAAYEWIPHCKLRKCYDGTMMKLEIVTTCTELKEVLRMALVQTGAKRLLGQAPEAGLEEALSKTLQTMSSSSK